VFERTVFYKWEKMFNILDTLISKLELSFIRVVFMRIKRTTLLLA
jgi:hypothetical protein